MRFMVLLLVLLTAGTSFAEDPLETLNTVEDTLTTMHHALKAQSADRTVAGTLYFLSEEGLGARDWISVTPCAESAASSGHVWKSRAAVASELRPGMLVVTQDEATNGGWVAARITDLADLDKGYVSISAPFRAQVKGLRVVAD